MGNRYGRVAVSLFARNHLCAFLLALGIASVSASAGAVELQLQNGWTNAPFATSNAEVFLDDGIVVFKGAIANGASTSPFTLPPAMRPATDVFVTVDLCSSVPGRLYIQPSGSVTIQSTTTFADAQCLTSLDGAMFAPSDAGFTALTLQNGWLNAPFSTSDAAASLSNGIVRLKGAVSDGVTDLLFTLPPAMVPATDVYVPVNLCGGVKGRLRIQPSGDVSVQSTTTLAAAQCFTSLDGVSFAPSASGFTALTLLNGWTNAPFSTSNAAVSLIDGIVRFKGAISGGTHFVLFTLPPAMRPAANVYVAVDLCNAAAGRLVIQPIGDVVIEAQGGAFSNAQCFTSLDGAAFVAPAPIGFTDLTLSNGWINYAGATQTAAVAIFDGIVHFKGAVSSGSSAVLFTLPITLRPEADVYVSVDQRNAAPGRLVIEPSGVVSVGFSTTFADAQFFTSLEGASFAPSPTGFIAQTLLNSWADAPFGTRSAAASIVDGIVHLRGAVSSGASDVLFTLPLAMRPATDVYLQIGLCNARKGRLYIQPTGDVSVAAEGAFGDAQCFTSLDGAKFAPSATGFTTLTLVNGWTHAPISTSNAAAAVKDRIVYLQGAIATGTDFLAFTLPQPMRPIGYAYVPVDMCNGKKGRIVIEPSGNVSVQAQSGAFSDAQCFTSLDGASLPEPGAFPALLSGLLLLAWLRMRSSR